MTGKLTNTQNTMSQSKDVTPSSPTPSNLKVDIFDSFDELAPMQQEWDNFVESVGGEIFLTYDWCRIWWKYYGKNRTLRVFVFRINNELLGIIPLFFEKIWLGPVFVRAVKIVGSDFTIAQFSLPIDGKHLKHVVREFFNSISRYRWDIIHIGPLAGLFEHRQDLETTFRESLVNKHTMLSNTKCDQTYFLLPNKWDDYLASLKKGERWDIKRSYSALQPDKIPLTSAFASVNDFDQIFEGFVEMHQSYWQSIGKLGHFGDWPSSRAFHKEVAVAQLIRDRLRLLEVTSGNQSLGYEYNYKLGDRYFEFLNARSTAEDLTKISLGRVVFCEQAKKALTEGVKSIDSMQGRYEHKLRLGGALYPCRSLYIIRNKLSSMIKVSIFRALASLLDLFYYRIWFCRLAAKLPLKRNPLWRIWIKTCFFS